MGVTGKRDEDREISQKAFAFYLPNEVVSPVFQYFAEVFKSILFIFNKGILVTIF